MRIVYISAENNGKASGGRRELGAAEKWLFDREDGEVRLETLMKMTAGQQGIAELPIIRTMEKMLENQKPNSAFLKGIYLGRFSILYHFTFDISYYL